MTAAIAEGDPSIEEALRGFPRPGEAPRRMSGTRERPHHEKPGVERPRATPAARKAQQRERMSDSS